MAITIVNNREEEICIELVLDTQDCNDIDDNVGNNRYEHIILSSGEEHNFQSEVNHFCWRFCEGVWQHHVGNLTLI